MKLKIAALMLFTCIGTVASAQGQNCAPREAVVSRLGEEYGESRQSIGMASENRVVEIFASISTGSWTITVTLPNGITCLVASGQAFEVVEEPVKPAGIRG